MRRRGLHAAARQLRELADAFRLVHAALDQADLYLRLPLLADEVEDRLRRRYGVLEGERHGNRRQRDQYRGERAAQREGKERPVRAIEPAKEGVVVRVLRFVCSFGGVRS